MMCEREFQLPFIFDDEFAGFVVMDVAGVDPSWRESELNTRPTSSTFERLPDAYPGSTENDSGAYIY